MAAPAQTKPVGDSVPKVNNEIAVGADLEFQRKWWRFERAIWVVFTILVLMDAAGVFGRGPFANAVARARDGSMDIKYERVERFSTPSVLTIHFGSSAIRDGKVQLRVSQTLVDGLGTQRVVPQPASTTVGEGGLLYVFPATAIPAAAEFALQPSHAGIYNLKLQVLGQEPVNLKIFVMP